LFRQTSLEELKLLDPRSETVCGTNFRGILRASRYRGTSLIRKRPPLGPYGSLSLGPHDSPRGCGGFLWARYPCRLGRRLSPKTILKCLLWSYSRLRTRTLNATAPVAAPEDPTAGLCLQGYLAEKKQPPPVGSPQGPRPYGGRESPAVGS